MIEQSKLLELKRMAEKQCAYAESRIGKRAGKVYRYASEQLIDHGNPKFFMALQHLREVPITMEEFLESPDFAKGLVSLWPKVKDDLIKANPDVLTGEAPMTEIVLGGATGWGKTTIAHLTMLYRLYWLQCFNDPQVLFNLSKSTKIVFVLQSLTKGLTSRILYRPLREMFVSMPYVQSNVSYNKVIESELRLSDRNIEVIQTTASANSVVSAAIVGAVIDEINFMAVVESSRKSYGARGTGGSFDQAEELYTLLVKRLQGRFMQHGGLNPHCLCILSSVKHEEDFISERVKEIERFKEKNVFVAFHAQYEVKPPDTYCGDRFKVLLGAESIQPRIIGDGEIAGKDYPLNVSVIDVPVEYKQQFRRDICSALKDICGVASASLTPLIRQKNKVFEAVEAWKQFGAKSWVENPNIDLCSESMFTIIPDNLPLDKTSPRFVGIDLSLNNDPVGIAIVKPLTGIVMPTPDDTPIESLPRFLVECALSMKPHPDKEIDIAGLRAFIMQLKKIYGMNIRFVAYDKFNSAESIQSFRRMGIHSGVVPVDVDDNKYIYLREAIVTNRILLPENEMLINELVNLEHNHVTNRVDHHSHSTKDISDAVCRAVWSCGVSREGRSLVLSGDSLNGELRRRGAGRHRGVNRSSSLRRRMI